MTDMIGMIAMEIVSLKLFSVTGNVRQALIHAAKRKKENAFRKTCIFFTHIVKNRKNA